ncbi:MAG: hypothetical protein ACJ759_04560, partial [Thermoanaerobaculia bacterium]
SAGQDLAVDAARRGTQEPTAGEEDQGEAGLRQPTARSFGVRWLRSSRLLRFPSPPAGGGWRIIRVPGIFLLPEGPRDVSNEPQDIYVESTMGGEFPGEVL